MLALVEHSIRLNLRGMSDTERQALSQDLEQKTGRNLEQTLAKSAMSAESRTMLVSFNWHQSPAKWQSGQVRCRDLHKREHAPLKFQLVLPNRFQGTKLERCCHALHWDSPA
ncbi:MAG: hypothetical protein SGJ27_27565 [Candidatus Melainabacteria bacterium]|nr:hypothetical protein [Candidatus Melainabacteria bacterium]